MPRGNTMTVAVTLKALLKFLKMAEQWDGCSGETNLVACAKIRRLQRKMNKYGKNPRIRTSTSIKPTAENLVVLRDGNTHFYRIREKGGSGRPPHRSFENR